MSGRLLNRELSWLDFNRRVLALAYEPGIPLLERIKFVAISSSNLDEFFQVRISALKDQVAAGVAGNSTDGLSPTQQLAAIGPNVDNFVIEQEKVLLDVLVPELAEHGLRLVGWDDLEADDRSYLADVFEQRIFPVLTPLAVDPAHPFPYISNLALSLAAMVSDPDTGERRFVRVKVPTVFPRLLGLPDGVRYLPVELLIAAQLHSLFVGMVVEEHAVFRVTRNVDLTLEDEDADDLLAAVEMELRRRRFGRAVRLEVQTGISEEMLELLLRELDLGPRDVTAHRAPLDLTCLWQLHALDRQDLKDRPWPPVTAGRIAAAEEADRSTFSVIRERPLMVHHPYESFASSSESFIAQAADDPRVQSIKMTLYRAGGDSPIARSLMRAAERGVQVAVLVELKAQVRRGDQRDVGEGAGACRRARRVRIRRVEDPCQVRAGGSRRRGRAASLLPHRHRQLQLAYGPAVRRRRDPHLRSGRRRRCRPVVQPSHRLQPRSRLRVLAGRAPRHRGQLIDLIEHEASLGNEGRITAKLDSLGDPELVEALYEASQAGVQIDLAGARHLLSTPRSSRAQRQHPRPLDPRSLPRTLTDHPLRARRQWSTALPDRVRRLDAAQPRSPNRGARTRLPSEAPRLARPRLRVRLRRRHRPLGDGGRGLLAAPRPGTVHRR